MELKVNGMMCSGCERRAKEALTNLGLVNVNADHNLGIVSFDETEIALSKIKEAINDLGFECE